VIEEEASGGVVDEAAPGGVVDEAAAEVIYGEKSVVARLFPPSPTKQKRSHLRPKVRDDITVKNLPDIEWAQCTECGKWRILPPNVEASSLQRGWTCIDARSWKADINCDVAEDQNPDDSEEDHSHCHQPRHGGPNVSLLCLTLSSEEVAWLQNELGLRICQVWNDGWCGIRVAAANRGSTMKGMMKDLLYFWDWKYMQKESHFQGHALRCQTKYNIVRTYEHQTQDGHRNQNVYFPDVAAAWIGMLRPIHKYLYAYSTHLPKRLWCPDDMFEALAIIDKSCLLIIDTKPNDCRPKYRVYGPERMVACATMAEATAAIRPLKVAGCDVRGVALDTDLGHYCSLFPIGQLPNFAGDNALGRWD
jgi:hypothetical protein